MLMAPSSWLCVNKGKTIFKDLLWASEGYNVMVNATKTKIIVQIK